MFYNKFGLHKNVECGLVYIFESLYETNKNFPYTPLIKRKPVPLQSVDIVASVVHAVAQVELTQVYVNKEDQPIEAIYYFPVDSNGGVTHFHAELEGRTITGVVKPEEEAKAQYEKAIEQKQTAFLVEANKPDIFKVRVGYLKPDSQVKIVIGYATEVKNEKGSNAIRFFIPTTVAPRYGVDPNEPNAKYMKMEFLKSSPVPLSLTVNVAIQGKIKSIESPTHQYVTKKVDPVPTKENWNRAVVSLKGYVRTDMDRDFVLLISPEDVHVPRLYSEKDESSTALMTHLTPSFNLDEQKVELLFVLDRSGSMEGSSIELAKKALKVSSFTLYLWIVTSTSLGLEIGSTFEFMFPESVKYDDWSLNLATLNLRKLRANLGGTEILEPLEAIYTRKTIPGYLRQIFVLTDGEVSNTDQVIGICQNNAHATRVFALGIGDSASHHLVEGMAEAGGGTAAFATNNEIIDSKILHQLQNAIQPALTNVSIKWTGLSDFAPSVVPPVEVNKEKTLLGYGKPISSPSAAPSQKPYWEVPQKVSPIFDGAQLVVFGVFSGELPSGVEITAESPDGPLSIQIKLCDENEIGTNGMIHKLAAIKAIRELELKVAGLIGEGKEGFGIHPLKAEIIRIGCQNGKYRIKAMVARLPLLNGLSSKYTSFVAVDTSSDGKVEDNWIMQTRYVPSQITHGRHRSSGPGWSMPTPMGTSFATSRGGYSPSFSRGGGMSRGSTSGARYTGRGGGRGGSTPSTSARRGSHSHQMLPEVQQQQSLQTSNDSSNLNRRSKRLWLENPSEQQNPAPKRAKYGPEAEEVKKTSHDNLHDIVATQSFNGSFPLNQEFSEAIGKILAILQQVAKQNGWDEGAWATALALTYLTEKLSDLKESYLLVEVKGRKWLQKYFGQQMEPMLSAAKGIIQSD